MITDSGGFQVFSLAHGNVADEIKGRRGAAQAARGGVLEISERGVALPLLHRRLASGSWARRSRWPCRRRSAPTSRSPSTSARPITPTATTPRARPSARTAGSTAVCAGTREHGPAAQAVFGIVQGGVHEDLRRESAEAVAAAGVDGIAIGGTLGRDKPEMHGVLDADRAACCRRDAPKHLLGIGEPDDLLEGIGLGIDVFDCAVPTRLARHGMALAPLPETRFRFDVTRAGFATDEAPLVEGCPCPTCARHTRAYLHYLAAGRGADRRPAADPAQPHLPRAPGRRRPGGDRSAAGFEAYRGGGSRRRRPVGGLASAATQS